MVNRKRTKIVITLGPATDKPTVLEKLIRTGIDLVRLNFSHGEASDHERRVNVVREIAKKVGREIGVLADLQGPKIRISKFKDGKIILIEDQEFILDAALANDAGDNKMVGIDYKALPNDVGSGDKLLLDDGRIVMRVSKVEGTRIICRVEVGGELSNNKGINREGGGLSAKALTEKDKQDLITAAKLGADYIGLSFPRSAEDILETKELLAQAKSSAGVIAKIERTEAIKNINEIIEASEGVMVARGDLGVEIGDAELPAVQKRIIQRARALNKPVITATQMMESMINNPIPTRAEVFDVANAVLDGTDAVMLSAESATGKYPDKAVEAMARACMGAEKQRSTQTSRHRMECRFSRVDEAIAMATMYTANHMDIKAIIALTESGSTPLWMSRIRSGIPIYALSRNIATLRKVTLYRDVYPIYFDVTKIKREDINKEAVSELEKNNIIQLGDLVILSKGDVIGVHGGSNVMKILQVGMVY